jgi:hypothetical protein
VPNKEKPFNIAATTLPSAEQVDENNIKRVFHQQDRKPVFTACMQMTRT